jgi:hypothetical protein
MCPAPWCSGFALALPPTLARPLRPCALEQIGRQAGHLAVDASDHVVDGVDRLVLDPANALERVSKPSSRPRKASGHPDASSVPAAAASHAAGPRHARGSTPRAGEVGWGQSPRGARIPSGSAPGRPHRAGRARSRCRHEFYRAPRTFPNRPVPFGGPARLPRPAHPMPAHRRRALRDRGEVPDGGRGGLPGRAREARRGTGPCLRAEPRRGVLPRPLPIEARRPRSPPPTQRERSGPGSSSRLAASAEEEQLVHCRWVDQARRPGEPTLQEQPEGEKEPLYQRIACASRRVSPHTAKSKSQQFRGSMPNAALRSSARECSPRTARRSSGSWRRTCPTRASNAPKRAGSTGAPRRRRPHRFARRGRSRMREIRTWHTRGVTEGGGARAAQP